MCDKKIKMLHIKKVKCNQGRFKFINELMYFDIDKNKLTKIKKICIFT